jgi:GAF domain-containing protein/anti-sigma regulatory factor (Ser/Thr protein kinase)/HAMP domain-containing protein
VRIRHRLIFTFALLLLPLFLLEVYDLAREYRERRAEILRGHRETAEAVAASVEVLLQGLVDRGRIVADAAAGSGRPEGEIRGLFTELRKWGPHIVTLGWAAPDGRILYTGPPELLRPGVTVADRPYFQAVVAGKDWVLGDLVQGRLEGRPIFILAAAARAGDRSLRGVVLIGVGPEIFERILGHVGGAEPRASLAILDHSGRAVYVSGQPDLRWEQRDWSGTPSIQQALRGEVVVTEEIRSATEDRARLGARVPIRSAGWVASVTTPVDDAMAPVRRAAWGQAGLLVGISLLSVVVAVLLGRGLSGPLEALRAEVQAVAGGDLSRRVTPQGRDEVADLGRTFNDMAARLDQSWRAAQVQSGEMKEKADRLEALSHLSRLLLSTREPDRVFDYVVTSATRLLDAPVALLLVVDPEAGVLVHRARAGMRHGETRQAEAFRRGEGLVGRVWEQQQPLVVADVREDPRMLNQEWVQAEGLHGFAGVPVMAGPECIGVLCVMRADPRAFTEQDREFLEVFAAHAAVAMENARLYAEAGTESGRLRALNAVARVISSSLDPESVFQIIVHWASRLLGNAVTYIMILDESTGEMRVRAAWGWQRADLRVQSTFRLGEGLPGAVAATRETVTVVDVLADPRFVNAEWAQAEGLRGFAGVPLVVADRCVGVLCVMRRSTAPWRSEDLELLEAFCAQAAVAIENSRLYAEAAARAAELDQRSQALEALNETARLISSEADFLPLLQKIADSARRLARSRYAALGALGLGGRLAHFVQSGLTEADVRRIGDLPTGKGILGVMLREGRPLRLPELGADPRSFGFPPNHPPMRSFMGVPIRFEGRVLGSLYLTEKLGGGSFTDQDEQLLMAFAAHAAITLEQSRLVEQTREDAATKATLLRELHHRVRNNLASIIGLLSMELTRPGGRSAQEAIQACIDRVHGIAEVHELLATGEFGSVDLSRVLEIIARSCFQQGGRDVKIVVEGPRLRLPARHLTALALIANEVLINASKHAFRGRDRGQIAIRTGVAGDRVTVEIRDDGVGLDPARAGDESGLGLEIVQALARADLGGEFRLYSDGGTVAVVTFPKPQPTADQREGAA